MVVSHATDFEFPIGEDQETSQELVFHLLLTQWNQIEHTEAGMKKAVLLETAKPHTILLNDVHLDYSNGVSQKKPISKANNSQLTASGFSLNASHLLSPLKSGTAIGAP